MPQIPGVYGGPPWGPWGPALRHLAFANTPPRFVPAVDLDGIAIDVHPVAEGVAAALVPLSRSFDVQSLRDRLSEVAQATLTEVQVAKETINVEFFAAPCHIGGWVGVVVGGFVGWDAGDADGGLAGAVAAVLVFLMVAVLQYRDERTDTL